MLGAAMSTRESVNDLSVKVNDQLRKLNKQHLLPVKGNEQQSGIREK